MDIDVPVEIPRKAKGRGSRPHITHRRLGRLLHDVAQLAGQRQAALALHDCRFGGQDGAADLGPRQAGR